MCRESAGTPASEWEVRGLSLGAHLGSAAPAAIITTLLLAGESSLKYLCDCTFGRDCTRVRKDSYLVETRKFAHVPCGAFCVLFCPDFPVKSSQYSLSIFLPLLNSFFVVCFSMCSFLSFPSPVAHILERFLGCNVFFWPPIGIWGIISLSQHPLSWTSRATAVSRWILKSIQGTGVTVINWWKLVFSKPQQLPFLWDDACCWMSCLTKEVLSCSHLDDGHCAVSIQLLVASFKPPDVWSSQLASAPLFVCGYLWNQRKKQVLRTSTEDQQYFSGIIRQPYTVQHVESHFYAFWQ